MDAKKYITLIRIILCLALIFLIGGFFLAVSKPENVFAGIAAIILSAFMSLFMIIPAVRLAKLNEELKENRIKKLEDEVEHLKQTLKSANKEL